MRQSFVRKPKEIQVEKILKNIEEIRKDKHIKQEVIAAELGIKQSSYSSYITRGSDITFSRLEKISEIFGVSVIDLIGWPERYVSVSSVVDCGSSCEKDVTIANLNKYIELLEKGRGH